MLALPSLYTISIAFAWVSAGVVVVSGFLGWIAFEARRRFRALESQSKADADAQQAKLVKTNEDLYVAEKRRNEQLVAQLEDVNRQLENIRHRLTDMSDENGQLRALNLQYQEEARADKTRIRNLEAEVANLKAILTGKANAN